MPKCNYCGKELEANDTPHNIGDCAEYLQAERDALVRWTIARKIALRWFQTSPSREEYKIACYEMKKAWLEIPEATRKEIEDAG